MKKKKTRIRESKLSSINNRRQMVDIVDASIMTILVDVTMSTPPIPDGVLYFLVVTHVQFYVSYRRIHFQNNFSHILSFSSIIEKRKLINCCIRSIIWRTVPLLVYVTGSQI